MTATQAILAHYQHLRADPREAALATVVKVEGSAYRRPGARMLVSPQGTRFGAISGGCLEADVALRAQQVLTTGEADYVLYDTRHANADLIVELGCQGAVGILIERTDNRQVRDSLQFLASFTQERGEGAMATVFRIEGDCPVQIGERLLQRGSEAVGGSLAISCLSTSLQQACGQVRQSGHAQTRTVRFSSGLAEVLIEPVHSPPALLLCGAGQDAIPLAQIARLLGWQVTVVDHRPSLLTKERFPGAETVLVSHPPRLPDYGAPDARTAVVLMTHSYIQDRLWLQHLLPQPFAYIGLLGPRKRAAQLLEDLRAEGTGFDAAWLSRLHSPVGLDLGSETSEEIALSVLSEIQAVLHNRAGGFLRDRQGSIHPTSSSPGAVCGEGGLEGGICPLVA
jgi:xanthine dehydrogenase accessory factor